MFNLQYKLSSWLDAEFDRLEGGTLPERQRYRNSMTAIAKVLSDPLNTDFKKDLPLNYKAVDVLQQYRLFFRIETDSVTQMQVIFFVWINNEDSIHRTGKSDDCYQVFREMLNRNEIEHYQPDPETLNQYLRHGDWGSDFIYLSYKNLIKSNPPVQQHADASLHLNKVTVNEYAIQSISVSHEAEGLAARLLSHLSGDADRGGITLIHELFIHSEHVMKSRHLLEKFQFKLIECIDDVEIWQRKK